MLRYRPCEISVSLKVGAACSSEILVLVCRTEQRCISENQLKRRHFGTLDDIQKSVTDELKGISALLRAMETTPPSLRSCPREQF
jgi:hypothetical protein